MISDTNDNLLNNYEYDDMTEIDLAMIDMRELLDNLLEFVNKIE